MNKERKIVYLKDEKVLAAKKKEITDKLDAATEMLRRGMSRKEVAASLGARLDFVSAIAKGLGLPSSMGRGLKDYYDWCITPRMGNHKLIRIPTKAFDESADEFKIETLDRKKKTMVVAWR